jgi:hypothetical protein
MNCGEVRIRHARVQPNRGGVQRSGGLFSSWSAVTCCPGASAPE